MSGRRVAVLGGGRSSEHEVSLASAASVLDGLREAGHAPFAIEIGRDTLAVARTGIYVGMGLSAGLMVVAAFGGIAPLQGAIAQEVIDVAAILNGLRALGGRDGAHHARSGVLRLRASRLFGARV